MNYCNLDVSNNQYFCDFTEKYYTSYKDCYDACGLNFKDGDNNVIIHISNVDFIFIVGIWAVLLSVSLFWAFHLSHD
jgi:hypothetical protein